MTTHAGGRPARHLARRRLVRWPGEQLLARGRVRAHVWATLRLLDACLALSPDQLKTAVPGTYCSILDTQRHLVGSDASYLFAIKLDWSAGPDADRLTIELLVRGLEALADTANRGS